MTIAMKVLLINPPQIFLKSVGKPVIFFPTGLAYVASAIEEEHDVYVLDACVEGVQEVREWQDQYYLGMDFEEIGSKIKEIDPDVVGVSIVFTPTEFAGLKTASIVKKVSSDILTVIGGPHPSVVPGKILENKDVDFVVINEGEHTFPELLDCIRNKKNNFSDIEGLAFKRDGEVIINNKREFIDDLDSLKFPARHLFPMELYHKSYENGLQSRELYNINVDYTIKNRNTTIITSRGCPFLCNFCSIHLTMGRKFRKRSPENVVSEIEEVVNKCSINHLNFEDDNITADRERARKLFELMIEKNIKITWSTPNGIRADTLDKDLINKMKKSGCNRVFVAPESGVQEVVDKIINKKMNLEKIMDAVSLFSKYGIVVDASFVIGTVGEGGRCETKREILDTIKYALKLKKLGMGKAGFNIFTPLGGTKMQKFAEKANFLKLPSDATGENTGKPIIETNEFTHKELVVLAGIGNWLVNYSFKEKIIVFFRHISNPFPYFGYFLKMFFNK
jgi:anaerobic magnesium-protoporphyrin IX monomethyl ester cyclase